MLVYVLVKFIAESAWCVAGRTRLRRDGSGSLLTSVLTPEVTRLVLARLAAFLAEIAIPPLPDWLRYAAVLLSLRWLAWGFVAGLIAEGRLRARTLVLGDRRSNLWRAGGMIVSSLADLAALLTGLRLGEFLP